MRFRIGDIYELAAKHYLVLGYLDVDQIDKHARYIALNLEKGIKTEPVCWHVDHLGVFVT